MTCFHVLNISVTMEKLSSCPALIMKNWHFLYFSLPVSVVLLWNDWILYLHHHPTYSAHRLCSFLEQGLGWKGWRKWQQMLVCRYIKKFYLFIYIYSVSFGHTLGFKLLFYIMNGRSLHFYLPQLCPGFHCCGAFLRLLHTAWWLCRTQSVHQP